MRRRVFLFQPPLTAVAGRDRPSQRPVEWKEFPNGVIPVEPVASRTARTAADGL